METIKCECGSILKKKSNTHFYSKRHQRYIHTDEKCIIIKTKDDRKEYQKERYKIRDPLYQDTILKWSGN